MQNIPNSKVFRSEATPVAPAMPCWHSFDAKRRLGYVLALAGSSAR